jgi:hypothetical protein
MEPNIGQVAQNKKILQDLEEKKKRASMRPGFLILTNESDS